MLGPLSTVSIAGFVTAFAAKARTLYRRGGREPAGDCGAVTGYEGPCEGCPVAELEAVNFSCRSRRVRGRTASGARVLASATGTAHRSTHPLRAREATAQRCPHPNAGAEIGPQQIDTGDTPGDTRQRARRGGENLLRNADREPVTSATSRSVGRSARHQWCRHSFAGGDSRGGERVKGP
jgi:hypothetical protein